jgi:hypothetical protein
MVIKIASNGPAFFVIIDINCFGYAQVLNKVSPHPTN